MTNKILKLILLTLSVIFLIALFIFISTRLPTGKTTITPTGGPEVAPPSASGFFLTITSPASGSTQSSKYLTVKGKTAPKADIFINDKEGKADANGNFSINITLDEGDNTITVAANDASGNFLEKELTVTVASFQ